MEQTYGQNPIPTSDFKKKALSKLGVKENFFKLIKGVYRKT